MLLLSTDNAEKNLAGVSPFRLTKLLRTLGWDKEEKALGGKCNAEETAEVSCYGCGERRFLCLGSI